MLLSLALIFLLGLALAALCRRVRLPRILGMLFTGVVLGPCLLNLLDDSVLTLSPDLRQMALIIILIKAGLSLDVKDLARVGRPAVLLSFVPALFEISACVLLAPVLLGVSATEAALLGAVLAAVSPAVVVPKMVALMEQGYGVKKGIPQMILAGASLDDVFVIVLFSTFVRMAQGGGAKAADFAGIPVSILLGILLGMGAGWLLAAFFEASFARRHCVRNSVKVILVLGVAFLLVAAESGLSGTVPVSGLLAVMSMACTLQFRSSDFVTRRLSEKFGKLWLAAEVILFVLVGAAVDVRYTAKAGPAALALIVLALGCRSLGVLLCLVKTPFNRKERLFCVISYLPKATVQAAIGSVPLALGLACGSLVLSVAVLSIVVSAPLGALGMDAAYRRCLTCDQKAQPEQNEA